MPLAPLLTAAPAIQIHTAAAFIALLSGAGVAILPKGVGHHRMIGSIAAGALFATALSSFWVFNIFPKYPSPIHLLSLQTLYSVIRGIIYRRQGNIKGHKLHMCGAYIGLIIAGLFTLLPGRILHAVAFGN